MDDLLEKISDYLDKGDEENTVKFTQLAISKNINPHDILNKGLIKGMNIVGEKFKKREYFLPDVLLAAKCMTNALKLLKPLLEGENVPTLGKIVIGTVRGDLHDIGKNLVGIMLKGAGFEVIDLGKDVPPEKFIETAIKENAKIIGMSALLTTTMLVMKEVTNLLKKQGLNNRIKTIIGGAPVSPEFAKEIGADAYAFDAMNAVDKVKELLKLS